MKTLKTIAITTLILVALCSVVNTAYSQNNGTKQETLVTRQMADKVATYMKTHYNSTTALFNQSNDIYNTTQRDEIIYNIHQHYDYVEYFIIGAYYSYGNDGAMYTLQSVGFNNDEIKISAKIYEAWKEKRQNKSQNQ